MSNMRTFERGLRQLVDEARDEQTRQIAAWLRHVGATVPDNESPIAGRRKSAVDEMEAHFGQPLDNRRI